MVHLIWLSIMIFSLIVLYKYKQQEINDLREVINHGRTYLKQKSEYYEKKDLNLKGKLKINIISSNVTKENPLILKFVEFDGSGWIETIDEKKTCYYSCLSLNISRIESLNGHKFRFASDFEAGMECQEPTVYAIGKDNVRIPLEVPGWESYWILIFDK